MDEKITSVSFNYLQTACAIATDQGFYIFLLTPKLLRQIKRPFRGGVKHCQMVGVSSFVILVPLEQST